MTNTNQPAPDHKAPAPTPADRVTITVKDLRVGDWFYYGGQGGKWVEVLDIEELSADEKEHWRDHMIGGQGIAGFTHRTLQRYSPNRKPHWVYCSERTSFDIWPR